MQVASINAMSEYERVIYGGQKQKCTCLHNTRKQDEREHFIDFFPKIIVHMASLAPPKFEHMECLFEHMECMFEHMECMFEHMEQNYVEHMKRTLDM